MHIVFDTDAFITQRRGGVRTYFTELINAVERHADVRLPRSFVIGASRLRAEHRLRPLPRLAERPLRALQLAHLMFGPLTAAMRIRRPVDIYHATSYATRLRMRRARRRVITVHDMTPELFPSYFPKGNPHGYKRENVEKADLILCVSETTKQDLMALWGVPASRIRVTPLASSGHFEPAPEGEEFQPYILFVGQRDGYKNFAYFLDVCRQLQGRGVRGRVVGAPLRDSEGLVQARALEELGIEIESVDDEALAQLYRSAIAFVYPSLYEGFGIPVLEAMASGCPCVLSDIGAFREVAADAAIFVSPDDPAAGADAVVLLAEDRAARTRLVVNGLRRVEDFSWERTAALTLNAYREVLHRD